MGKFIQNELFPDKSNSNERIEVTNPIDDAKFYHKNSKREIVPVDDEELNLKAQKKILEIIADEGDNLPEIFIKNKEDIKLYNPKGNIEKANALLLDPKDGAYSLSNKLNHMTGKEWTKFTCSWFIFNALPSDLKE